MIHDEKKKINDKAQKGDRDGVYMCRGETVERDKNNLYGSISEAGEKTIFCTAAFRKNEKSGCYGSNQEGEQVLGFIVLIPYKDMVMADYLACHLKFAAEEPEVILCRMCAGSTKIKKLFF